MAELTAICDDRPLNRGAIFNILESIFSSNNVVNVETEIFGLVFSSFFKLMIY